MKKVAFITGGAGYIGSQTAVTLAKAGVSVAICDINEDAINAAVKRVQEVGGEARGYTFDITNSRDVDRVVDDIVRDFGRLDILVHVAGGSSRLAGPNTYHPLIEQEDYVIDTVLKVNLYGAFYADRAAARVMVKQGEGGKIINFSSAVGLNGLAECCDYAASKGGVISLTKSLAKELGPYKINVNSVAPGVVQRPGEDGDPKRTLGTNFLGEKCVAEDIANLVEFLASDKARFITGQVYVCDGGRSLAMKGTD